MASLALDDMEPELLEKLELQAKRLGITVASAAVRALREHLAEQEQVPPVLAPGAEQEGRAPAEPPSAPETLAEDPRFVWKHGMWVFTGKIDPRLIPDHRDLREERIDSFVRAALGESSD